MEQSREHRATARGMHLQLVRDDEHAARLAAQAKARRASLPDLTADEWRRLSEDERVDVLMRRLRELQSSDGSACHGDNERRGFLGRWLRRWLQRRCRPGRG